MTGIHRTLLLFIFAGYLSVISCSDGCPQGWVQFDNSCYLFSTNTEIWILAEGSCIAHNARLAEIHSQRQQDFLKTVAKVRGHSFWIGARDDVVEGVWQWASTNEVVNFTSWASGKPNNLFNEDCLILDSFYQMDWNDQDCHFQERYICEKRKETGGDLIVG